MKWKTAKAIAEVQIVDKLTCEALKIHAGSEYLYTEVLGKAARDRLLRAGWDVVDSRPATMAMGTSFTSKTLLRRHNPEYRQAAG